MRCDGALLSWPLLNTSLVIGRSELIPCLPLPVYASLVLPIKLSFSQPSQYHFTVTLPILSPIPLGGVSKLLYGPELWLGLNHDTPPVTKRGFNHLDPGYPASAEQNKKAKQDPQAVFVSIKCTDYVGTLHTFICQDFNSKDFCCNSHVMADGSYCKNYSPKLR